MPSQTAQEFMEHLKATQEENVRLKEQLQAAEDRAVNAEEVIAQAMKLLRTTDSDVKREGTSLFTALTVVLGDYEGAKSGRDFWMHQAQLAENSFSYQKQKTYESLLQEWLATPYFEDEGEWKAWVQNFKPRVEAAINEANYPANEPTPISPAPVHLLK